MLGWVGFYRWLVERDSPIIIVPQNFVGFGTGAQRFVFQIQDPLSGLRGVKVSLEQNGRNVQLFEREYPRGMLIDDPSFFVDAKALGLEPGTARIKFWANDRSMWRNSTVQEQQIILDYDPPKIEVLQFPASVKSGSLEYGIFRITDNNPVRAELNLDGRQFLAERVRSTDVSMVLFSTSGSAAKSSGSLSVIDAVGNKSLQELSVDLKEGSGGKDIKSELKFDVLKETLVRMFERYRTQRRALDPDDSLEPPKGTDPEVMAQFVRQMEVEFGAFTDKLTQPVFRSLSPSVFWSRHFAKFSSKQIYSYDDRLSVFVDEIASFNRLSEGYFIDSKYGTPVFALNDGRVVYADLLGPRGEAVVVDHGFGLFSIYSNLESISVREGDEIERGDPIARVGRTGIFPKDGYEVRFRVREYPIRADELVDPEGVMTSILKAIKGYMGVVNTVK
jgi:murein DD-endopeptidase MepM/ murein hydrolase activator NlpD